MYVSMHTTCVNSKDNAKSNDSDNIYIYISGGVLCYTLRNFSVRPSVCLSVRLSVCPSALRFRALTLVHFDLFSSNFAQTLVWDRSGMGLQVG